MRAVREHVDQASGVSWQFHVRRQTQFPFTWHFHPELELTLITRGGGTRIVGDSIDHYRPGDLTLIGADLPHTYVSAPGTDDHEAIVIQFRRDFLGRDLLRQPEFTDIARLLDHAGSGLHYGTQPAMADRLRALLARPPLERTLGLVRLLARLADDRNALTLATAAGGLRIGEPVRQRIEAVCSYLQSAYDQPVRLAEVAAVAHMSPTAFSRFFRRALGRTMTDYVTELRIAAACQLLVDTDLPIAEVAGPSGYENLSNFNRRFRMLKGLSPREYRRIVRGEQLGKEP